jgi:hypothetical protein
MHPNVLDQRIDFSDEFSHLTDDTGPLKSESGSVIPSRLHLCQARIGELNSILPEFPCIVAMSLQETDPHMMHQ